VRAEEGKQTPNPGCSRAPAAVPDTVAVPGAGAVLAYCRACSWLQQLSLTPHLMSAALLSPICLLSLLLQHHLRHRQHYGEL
jgi:hypothetical protein